MTVIAMTVALANGFMVEIPLQVVDDYKIEQSVIVYIDPGGGDRPHRSILRIGLVQARFGYSISERSIPVVVIERVVMNARDKDVFVAVVIVVPNSDASVVRGAN